MRAPEINKYLNFNNSREHVLNSFKSTLSVRSKVAVIHSDLSNFRTNSRNFLWDLLHAISFFINEGWTLVFPSFTFSFCSGKPFIKNKSLSETGILAEKVLQNFSSAKRTNHPIYSFVVIGKKSNELLSLDYKTTFGISSPFEWFEKNNALVAMVGCDWKYCTQFHRYEELAKVKYREYKTFEGQADYGNGLKYVQTKMFVRTLDLNPINDFSPALEKINSFDGINVRELYGNTIQTTEIKNIKDVCSTQLIVDSYIYLLNKNYVMKKIRDKIEKNSQKTQTISVLGQKNNEILERHLNIHLENFLPERNFKIKSIPYGQISKKLFNRNDELYLSPPYIKIFSDRLEDIPGVDLSNSEITLNAIKEYTDLISDFHKSVGGWSIINLFTLLKRSLLSNEICNQNELVFRSNKILIDSFKDSKQVTFVDLGFETSIYSGQVSDSRLEFLGKFPWSDGFSNHLAKCWTSLIISMLEKDTRLIIVDLDNTLWGGVIGEDGIEGVKIGGDFPGNAFKAFQIELLNQSKRGIAIAIASKNNEDLALEAISKLPEMIIRKNDVQAYEINWDPKWKNIIKICDKLNLGLGSVLFIDDNPIERELVKRNLPDVKILPLTNDPSDYISILKSCPYLRPANNSKEDLGRLNDFSAQKKRAKLKSRSVNLEDYFASLNISLNLNPLNDGNSQRAAQLCQKTNQFNTTTRRYDQKQLYELESSGSDVFIINYKDKYSPAENLGLIILKYKDTNTVIIDLFLLSCRVLGRGIETIIPKLAIEVARKKGCKKIIAEIVKTTRNIPVREVFKDSGFLKKSKSPFWVAEIKKQSLPKWVDYRINLGE
tara:strand:- start:8624 stop:11113 length:2490 start_codon:yes stop_codon:yes gene_type:complete